MLSSIFISITVNLRDPLWRRSDKVIQHQVCGFNDNRNYNFFLESVLKNRVRIIYGCALYTGKYGNVRYHSVVDLGEGTLCPLLFLDQTEAQRAKKIFLGGTGPPLSTVLDAPPAPISRSGFGTAFGLHTKSGLGN